MNFWRFETIFPLQNNKIYKKQHHFNITANYLTLRELALELDKNILDAVVLVKQEGIPHSVSGGKARFSSNGVFAYQLSWLENDASAFPEKQLTKLVDFYTEQAQQDGREGRQKVERILRILYDESPERIEQAAGENDYFYQLAQHYFPELFVPTEELEEAVVPLYLQKWPKRKISPQKRGALKRTARSIVNKVSRHFDADLPNYIKLSPERRNYASIRYNKRKNFAEAEVA